MGRRFPEGYLVISRDRSLSLDIKLSFIYMLSLSTFIELVCSMFVPFVLYFVFLTLCRVTGSIFTLCIFPVECLH